MAESIQQLRIYTVARELEDQVYGLVKALPEDEVEVSTATDALKEGYTSVIKQSWGLIKYLKRRQDERRAASDVAAKEEQVAARA